MSIDSIIKLNKGKFQLSKKIPSYEELEKQNKELKEELEVERSR